MLNQGLSRSGSVGPVTSDQLRQLLNAKLLTAGDAAIRLALQNALNLTFWAMWLLALGTVLAALLVPHTSAAPADRAPAPVPTPAPAPTPQAD